MDACHRVVSSQIPGTVPSWPDSDDQQLSSSGTQPQAEDITHPYNKQLCQVKMITYNENKQNTKNNSNKTPQHLSVLTAPCCAFVTLRGPWLPFLEEHVAKMVVMTLETTQCL